MGERLTKGQKISDGKGSGGGEREKRLQLSRDERGQRVRAGGTQQGGEGLNGGGVGGGRRAEFRDYLHRHAPNLICISESEDACQAVSVRHRQMLCCCCCVRLSDRSEAFWETNSITSAGLSQV